MNHFNFQPRFYTTNEVLAAAPEKREGMLQSNEFQFSKMTEEIRSDLHEIRSNIPNTPEHKAKKKSQAELRAWMTVTGQLISALR